MSNGVINGQTEVPGGIICMWSGQVNNIPGGWALCDGQNGTPDLRDRFILGAGRKYGVGVTGGEERHTLVVNEMPSHIHGVSGYTSSSGLHTHTNTLSTNKAGTHTHTVSVNNTGNFHRASSSGGGGTANCLVAASGVTNTSSESGEHSHTVTGSIANNGEHTHTVNFSSMSEGQNYPHNNMPPYYALCFIMKLQNLPSTRGVNLV